MILSNEEYKALCENPEHLKDDDWIAFYMFPESEKPSLTNGQEIKARKEINNKFLWGKSYKNS